MKESKPSIINLIMGGLFIVGGVFLLNFLWGKGLISWLPFFLIGIGALALSGAIK